MAQTYLLTFISKSSGSEAMSDQREAFDCDLSRIYLRYGFVSRGGDSSPGGGGEADEAVSDMDVWSEEAPLLFLNVTVPDRRGGGGGGGFLVGKGLDGPERDDVVVSSVGLCGGVSLAVDLPLFVRDLPYRCLGSAGFAL